MNWRLFFPVVFLQKAVLFPLRLPTRKGVQVDGVYGIEHALFDVRVIAAQVSEHHLDLLALGRAHAVGAP